MPFFGDMVREAVFSENGLYRYSLTRIWQDALPVLFVVMLNPSIGDGNRDDPTIRNVIVFAQRNKYGGIMIVNLHAIVSSDPKILLRVRDPIGPENKTHLFGVVDRAQIEGGQILCAWGASMFIAQNIDLDFIQYARAHHVRLVTLGKTKSGAPRHPLYTPYSTPFEEY